jgi:hypothetical protein
MQSWKLWMLLVVAEVVSFIPVAGVIWLWPRLLRQPLAGVRRILTNAGLGSISLASLVPPFWLPAMHFAAHASDGGEAILTYTLAAVFAGLAAAISALCLLSFASGRPRSIALAICTLTLILFALTFSIVDPGVVGI